MAGATAQTGSIGSRLQALNNFPEGRNAGMARLWTVDCGLNRAKKNQPERLVSNSGLKWPGIDVALNVSAFAYLQVAIGDLPRHLSSCFDQ